MRFQFRLTDIIDIIIVAVILYRLYKNLRGTAALRLFVGVLVFVVVWLAVSFMFQMQLLGAIMDQIVNVGVIAVIILFQDEIRHFFTRLGSSQTGSLSRFFGNVINFSEQKLVSGSVMQIVMACRNMSREKVGALIVLPRSMDLRHIVETGEELDARISTRLIENIFFKNSPLHDGAMVINNGLVRAAGCILPVTHSMDVDPALGLRHRAALGMTEKSDACCIVVSEETGKISWTEDGTIETGLTQERLEKKITSLMTNSRS